jgi:transcriptional regulator with XRE-family HTH domain
MTVSPGTRIKELRTLAGMSQEELGRRIGVQRAAVNKYEKGSVTNIPIAAVEKIANVFEVSPSYILGWKEAKSSELALEVKVIQGVQHFFGKEAVDLLENYVCVTKNGKKRILEYSYEVSKLYHEED